MLTFNDRKEDVFWKHCKENQSIENAGVALVKEAKERNESFEKINKK